MANERRIIRLGAYFAGEEGVRDEQVQQARNDALPSPPETQFGYQPAGSQKTADGTLLPGVMRRSPAGLGVVIPKATMGGIPQGSHPHAVRDVEVTIDPHIAGQSVKVRLGDITKESVAAGTAAVDKTVPEATNIETRRLRGAAIMHNIAAAATGVSFVTDGEGAKEAALEPVVPGDPMVQNYPPTPQGPQIIAATTVQAAMQAQLAQPAPASRRVSPLSAFNQSPSRSSQAPQVVDSRNGPPAAQAAAQPTIEVTFQIDGFGIHQAFYHDVIIQPAFIILVYDNRYQGPRYFPPVSDEQPVMALNVTGTTDVYRVQTTGVQYPQGYFEHCVLMIEERGDLSPE